MNKRLFLGLVLVIILLGSILSCAPWQGSFLPESANQSIGSAVNPWGHLFVDNITTTGGSGFVTTSGGTLRYIPYFTAGTNIENSGMEWDTGWPRLAIAGAITATGDIYSNGDINAGNDLNCINDLDVTDDADVGGDLDVVGRTDIGGDLDVVGDFRVTSVIKFMRLPMESFRKGVSAPPDISRSGYAGWEFDTAARTATLETPVPFDWDGVSDIYFYAGCVLLANETNGDDIDWVTSIKSVADKEDIDVAGTQTPSVNYDIGTDVNAGTLHYVPIILDYDSLACPLTTGDCLSITVNRSANIGGIGYVDDVMVVGFCIRYYSDRMGP